MDPVNPWLDPSEVRRLAEQLLRPVATDRLDSADPWFDSSFVGFTSKDTVAADTKKPEPAAPEPSPVPEIPPASPSLARLLQRIYIFRDWLVKNFQAEEIFILDCEGKVIFDESGHGRHHFMGRNLASASHGSGYIHVKIGPGAILDVIPCETPYGRIVLGALVPDALPPDYIRTITEILIQTASPA